MIVPDPSPLTAPFWDAATKHRLLMRYCSACGTWRHPQVLLCSCGSEALEWREATGYASLISYTVTRKAILPGQIDVPYTLLLVRLFEGPQLVSSLPGDGYELYCGMQLRVQFDDIVVGERVWSLPRFVGLQS